ncbi:MAG: Zn-binding domain-containing protein, partial [Nitrospinota bacterium]
SAHTVASRLFARALLAGFKTIVFTKGRRAAELIYTWTLGSHPELRGRVSSYRAGFLPEERRQVERQLKRGGLAGVVSTSALELGVDIGGLDVCILVGYPGSIINTWQRGGRVGRGERESLIALIAERDALDQYLVTHPEDFFGRPFERATLDPENPYLLAQHLPCAAAELPLEGGEPTLPRAWRRAAGELEDEGELLRSAEGERWFAARRRPHRRVDLRGAGESFAILEGSDFGELSRAEPIGHVNGHQALTECHPGAIYLHRGRQYEVAALDLERRNVRVRPSDARYFTRARTEKETEILTRERSRSLGNARLHLGRLRVTTHITGYEKRSTARQERLGVHPLELPPTTFETVGFWVELEEALARGVAARGLHFMGGIHAAEHAAIGLFPLFALCDRDDIGGISTPLHPQVGKGAIFFYDGHPGGVGLAEQGFEQAEALFAKTLEVVEACPCEGGCPSCVHSPKCGSGNYPLDKEAAIWVLRMVLGREELPPREEGDAPPLEPRRAEPPRALPDRARAPRVLVLDLETQRSAEEVGGWERADRMGLACAVLWRWPEGGVEEYLEEQAPSLLAALRGADLVVGFNILGFDYQVLRAHSRVDLARALPTFDMLRDLAGRIGFRPSLGALAQATLGAAKLADGLQSLAWWRAGERQKVLEYCRADAALTGELFCFGLERGHLLLERKGKGKVRIPLDWTLEGLLARARQGVEPPRALRPARGLL